jgi:hypothetical protein
MRVYFEIVTIKSYVAEPFLATTGGRQPLRCATGAWRARAMAEIGRTRAAGSEKAMSDETTELKPAAPAPPGSQQPGTPGLTDAQRVHADVVKRTAFRTGGPGPDVADSLGLLREFSGNWRGHGFNLTARPFFKATPPFFLELNETRETLDFTDITGAVPNRGSIQDDIFLHAVRYVQQVLDVETDTGIHVETGMWIRVPNPPVPAGSPPGTPVPDLYFRQSTIPHGDSLLAQSLFATEVNGGPDIKSVNTTPFTDVTAVALNGNPTAPLTNPEYLAQYGNTKLPAAIVPTGFTSADVIKDPTILLRGAIAKQTITKTIVIGVSTANPGMLVNIPFVQKNANATALDAIFWVEWVRLPEGRTFLQLQYVQRVILDFLQLDGKTIHWPHVSVATLKRV